MAPPEENAENAEAPVQCALINPNLRLPSELNLLTGNVAENYKSWRRQIEIYLIASGTSKLPRKFKLQQLSTVEVSDF